MLCHNRPIILACMTIALFTALLTFAFVASITPGPNNLMLLASGANFGIRRTLPHMFGVSLGHSFMVFIVGLGLAGLFIAFPQLQLALGIVAGGYMLWLAWKIAQSAMLETLYAAPGNPGIAEHATLSDLDVADHDAVVSFCREKQIGLVVVGPEAPLAAGIADRFWSAGQRCFGQPQAR